MKKQFTLLIVLLSTVFPLLAQDTITGIVNRITAPYFEQNVCNDRFAIVSENETYYVMVDNYWPNPYLEDLVIHYDTIAIGNEISVIGDIKEMEDGNGEVFKTIDISRNLNSTHKYIPGFFFYEDICYPGPNPVSATSFVKYTGTERYFITINGELQTEIPFSTNGRTLVESKRYLFVGNIDSRTDYNGNTFLVYELFDAQPMDQEDFSISGILTSDNDLYISWPREESPYLSVFDGVTHHYVTNKGALQNRYTLYDIRNAFGNNTTVVAGGFEFVRYDLFGSSFLAFEGIKIETEEQTTLTGMLTDAGTPYIGMGPPIPSVEISFYSNGHHYIDNPLVWDSLNMTYLYNAFIVGNDTIYFSDNEEVTATFIPRMIMNNYRNPVFYILIREIEGLTGVQELDSPEIQVFPNPTNDIIYISCKDLTIQWVDVLNSRGSILLSKSCNRNEIQFIIPETHSLMFLRIELSNGNVIVKKIVVR